jgi:serine/threonine-protein kinase
LLEPGQKIFEYAIIRQLGQGGFGTVYQAHDRMLDRHVAIKQLLSERTKDEKVVKRFMQEARVIAALEHPNVVTIYALRIQAQQIYMILEYLTGGSVRDLLNRQKRLALEPAVKLTTGICEGLAKLHAMGIIHRDIKAENILLTADGLPKITDFGIAHVPTGVGGMDLTRIGFQPSTVIFSSPEQFNGEKVDARSDVYQVGELIYQMLTGRHYIDVKAVETQATTLKQNLRHDLKVYMVLGQAICKDPPPALPALRQEFGSVADVIAKAMAKRKEDRYADTLEFAADLWAAHFSPAKTRL